MKRPDGGRMGYKMDNKNHNKNKNHNNGQKNNQQKQNGQNKNQTANNSKPKNQSNQTNQNKDQNNKDQVKQTNKTNTVKANTVKEAVIKETPAKETPMASSPSKEETSKKDISQKETVQKETVQKETSQKETSKQETVGQESVKTEETKEKGAAFSAQHVRVIGICAVKVALSVAAFVIVIAAIVSLVKDRNDKSAQNAAAFTEESTEAQTQTTLPQEPLEENAYPEVNTMVNTFYQALADGDMDVVHSLKDYTNDKELVTYQTKSEYIESYNNITCYTKPGIEENSYFLYVCYDVKFYNIETTAPGLNAWYVYTNEEGALLIDGDMEENITAALKLVTSQDDVVDLYNKVDVSYKEAIAEDEALNTLLAELPAQIKSAVGVALAQLEVQNQESQTEEEQEATSQAQTETTEETQEQPVTQAVNQKVRTTDTVNVRSSDSEEADKIGRAQQGEELTRIEEKINGWSKVIFEGKEAYIKSDYLEVISEEAVSEAIGTVTATTNVNVRNSASQDAEKIGVAQEEVTFNLLEDLGEWLKIEYNGQIGYVKAEYFE